jgi:urocanate hydratase
VELGFIDVQAESVEHAVELATAAAAERRPLKVALLANAADVCEAFVETGHPVDVVTDQTSAHDMLHGYVPSGYTYEHALELRAADPDRYVRAARATAVRHVTAMVELQRRGKIVFDYGNNLRQEALNAGCADAFAYDGFCKLFLRPLFCEGRGPYRWICLSKDPEDMRRLDDAALATFPDDQVLARWIPLARKLVPVEGYPARVCYMGYGQRATFGLVINDLVRSGEISAPVVISRDHLDTGSVASPNRETEGMQDGSDAIADWPMLNFVLNAACGATWLSMHNGGGVGIGYATHAGMAIVCDGTAEAATRIERVLTVDPGIGVVRHADAGYESAAAIARERGIRIPMPRR